MPNERLADASLFAYTMLKDWNLGGDCHDDMIIFYSAKDNVVSMAQMQNNLNSS